MAYLAPRPDKLAPSEEHNNTPGKVVKPEGDSGNYIRWDAKGVTVEPSEEEKKIIADVAAQFNRFQKNNYNEHGHAFRGTHVKTQGCVAGVVKVKDDLPAHLAQGMFKKPGTYDCIMRYSSLTPKLLPDTASAPRGAAIKIFGIKGEKIFQNPDHDVMDWTFNNWPILELRTAKDTNEIADSLERNWNDGDGFVKELQARDDAEVACSGGALPQQHMAAMPQYSQSAYRYGDYVAKLGLFPKSEAQEKLKSWSIKESDPINILSTTLQDLHEKETVTYSLCVQLLQNLEEQPVEDIGVEWDSKKYPFEEVATVEFKPQDSFNPKFINYFNDRITCNTWHGLVEHTPLGSTNRTRRVVYAESRKLRLRLNGYDDFIEPKSLAEVPVN